MIGRTKNGKKTKHRWKKEYAELMTESFDCTIHLCVLEDKGESERHPIVSGCGHVFAKRF